MLANVMQTKTLQTLKTRQLLPVEAVTRSWKILSIKGSTLCQGHYYGNFLLSFPLKMRLLIPLLSPHSFWKGKKYLLIYYEGLKYILAPAFVVFIFGLLCPIVSTSSSLLSKKLFPLLLRLVTNRKRPRPSPSSIISASNRHFYFVLCSIFHLQFFN